MDSQVESDLLEKINAVLQEHGVHATDLGPDSVAVMGDARFYGPCVFVSFPTEFSMEQIGRISTRLINEVPGVSRVLMEVEL